MSKKFLGEMIKELSPSGREDNLQKLLARHYKTTSNIMEVNEKGCLTSIYNKESNFKVMLAAHADEISLIVTGYNPDGSLQVSNNGGIRAKVYLGANVQILTNDTIYKGVVGVNSSLMKKEKIELSSMFIDLGFKDKAEAIKKVNLGSYVIHDTDMVELANDCLAGRAFDDRIGDYIIHEAAVKASKKTKNGIYVSTTTGEETTGRGAYQLASHYKPNLAVIVDVTYANDYLGSDYDGHVELGKGGVICEGSIPNRKLNTLLANCAKELKENVQYEVFSGRTGTDGDTMVRAYEGIPVVLFSIPLRYMHSPIEILDFKDVTSMIDILALFIEKINEDYSLIPFEIND